MSMTRKEAADIIENKIQIDVRLCTDEEVDQYQDALYMALSALRTPTREQMEKVWRGCEKCNGAGEYSRYAENLTKILLAKYCPHCGRPLADEAVEMVMERINEMEEITDEH